MRQVQVDAPAAVAGSGNQEEPGAAVGVQGRQFAQGHSYTVQALFGLHTAGQMARVCSTPENRLAEETGCAPGHGLLRWEDEAKQ